MSLIAAINYDPGTLAQASCASALAMTALDTTNLRATFAPASTSVFVRASIPVGGGTGGFPGVLLGILEGATVVARLAPIAAVPPSTQSAASMSLLEFSAVIPSVTVASHTWDLAYGVESALASTNLNYGGPNDTAGADAFGGATFEVYDTGSNYLGGILYDPASAAATAGMSTLKAMTALDTTNLRLTFTAPASGKVFWRQRYCYAGSTSSPIPTVLLGMLESTTVVARKCAFQGAATSANANSPLKVFEASGIVTGVGAGSHTWDAAYAVQLVLASSSFKWGGPNNTTSNDAWGAAVFELWAA